MFVNSSDVTVPFAPTQVISQPIVLTFTGVFLFDHPRNSFTLFGIRFTNSFMKPHSHWFWYLLDREPLGGSAPEPEREREINGFGWWSLTLLLSALLLHRVPTQPHLCHPPAALGWFISANLLSLMPTLPSSPPTCVFTRALPRRTFPTPPPYEKGTCRRYLKTMCVVEKSAALW